ncbi:MAG TPA: tetratricopeptide repeat protein [Pyrinomonadaceae bacterium]|nr:tetratricopeptide repeat protein [Pyrinomonadaceae bacterium]
MFSFPARLLRRLNTNRESVVLLMLLCLPAGVVAQGSGRESTGTGGNHVIQGKIFFPSGRRAEGNIQVKLQSFGAGEVSTIADSSGSFTFTSLAPGNYTVVINAGDEYEIANEGVTIDSDLNISRSGISLNSGTRRYTVMVTLQVKASNHTKASVVNATLAEVPPEARASYEKALQLAKSGESARAIENLKTALSLYPKFPLALNELGVQYLKIGQANNAVEPLRSATLLSPDAATPKLNLGIALLETQRYNESETQLRNALRITATPTSHMYLGLTLSHLQNNAEAEKELKAAIETSGDQLTIAHYYLGGLYWKMDDYHRAVDELETYLRLTPDAPDAERVRGTIKQLRSKS